MFWFWFLLAFMLFLAFQGKLSVFIKSQRSPIRKKIFDSKSSKNKWLPVILRIDKGVDRQVFKMKHWITIKRSLLHLCTLLKIQIVANRRIKDTMDVISIDNLGFRLNCTTLRRGLTLFKLCFFFSIFLLFFYSHIISRNQTSFWIGYWWAEWILWRFFLIIISTFNLKSDIPIWSGKKKKISKMKP